jgi:hypothetical protein
MTEQGWFMPFSELGTSAAYWMTPEIVYAVDYTRGLDVLKYSGPLRTEGDPMPAPGGPQPEPAPKPAPKPEPKPEPQPVPVEPVPSAQLPATGLPALPVVGGVLLLTVAGVVRKRGLASS